MKIVVLLSYFETIIVKFNSIVHVNPIVIVEVVCTVFLYINGYIL